MSRFPILETERFVLRQLNQDDSREIFQYFSLDEVTKFYDLESFTNIEQAEELIDRWNQKFERNQGIRWGITLRSESRVIGTCGFHGWMKNHYKAEIGYELTPEYWRQGYMSEVIQKAIEFGFNNLGLNRIQAFVEPENVGSRRVLEKIGFSEEGTLKEHFYWRNRFVDTVIYALLKKDYKVR
ncbi:GNAT family N-acetyltransferase [Paenibacillus sabinae]|uniref:GCN5-like N-acetyltransferase n=1 Tax=Paenibacillus sabinae T27 TaxID=1268072 RepID=X4ZBG7_9BACL|nr:GNAT family protein [Paenibacillus sabinae]AHV96971.1 GCN5-like N-acetyltransferase [Paenibacillus sabinae T27]